MRKCVYLFKNFYSLFKKDHRRFFTLLPEGNSFRQRKKLALAIDNHTFLLHNIMSQLLIKINVYKLIRELHNPFR